MTAGAANESTENSTEMTVDVVLWFLNLMAENGIDVVVDGGWGVDALLGWQSRTHLDLDIALKHRDSQRLRQVLDRNGYVEVHRKGTHAYNFVLQDSKGHVLDAHSYEFDDDGKFLFGIPYPLDSLTGTGNINGRTVRCITAERMVEFHTAYDGDETDRKDVLALCAKFEIPVPDYYAHWPTPNEDDPRPGN
jgi:lincosamide nucleotidyltransferase A/C/D/E